MKHTKQSHHLMYPTLRESPWAMSLLGYSPGRRSAFWQFVYSNGVPHIRTGKRKIQFSEQAVMDWLVKKSVGGDQ